MKRFEPVLQAEQPEAVLVVGDVNSTIGCALVTSKFFLDEPFRAHLDGKLVERRRPLMIHVEAGLRSRDDDMPEEINRKLTDAISDLLFVSDPAGMEQPAREGVPAEPRLLRRQRHDRHAARRARAGDALAHPRAARRAGARLRAGHAASAVERRRSGAARARSCGTIEESAGDLPLVFPVHPRTRARLAEQPGCTPDERRWRLIEPLGYLDFLKLTAQARIVLTDSGGVQEETTVLGVPCVTLRENTERPVTITEGTNFLAGTRARRRCARTWPRRWRRRRPAACRASGTASRPSASPTSWPTSSPTLTNG